MAQGNWGGILNWPLIGIHSVLTKDGKLLTFGTDTSGVQGGMMYHDLWDPVTGTHTTIEHHQHAATDIFCAGAIALPGTDDILIVGGDARPFGAANAGVDSVNVYDATTQQIMPSEDGNMTYARWYGTVISLPTGQIITMGGIDRLYKGVSVPEIYTPGEGWRELQAAYDTDVGAAPDYPRAFLGPTGEVFYFANGTGTDSTYDLMALNPAGEGSLRRVMQLPFQASWETPSIMFEPGKILVSDATTGLWVMNLNSTTPTVQQVATLPDERNWSNMTVLADGKVLITGGTAVGNSEATANRQAVIWDPATNVVTPDVAETQSRLYHSSAILLPDATVLSLGGGAANGADLNHLDGEIYTPAYLLDDMGIPATRPIISGAPASVIPGDSFALTVEDSALISKLTLVKAGAVTHAYNMDSGAMTLTFDVVDSTTIQVHLPANANTLTAGNWMLFAWNTDSVPSKAPIISVTPTVPYYTDPDGPTVTTLTTGDDTYASPPGADRVDGGDGTDTVSFTESRYTFSSATNPEGFDVITLNGEKAALLKNVERLQFADGTLVKDTQGSWILETEGTLPGVTYLTTGNDTLNDAPGVQILDGGAGIDSLIFAGNGNTLNLHNIPDGFSEIFRAGETVAKVRNFERIVFDDRTLMQTANGNWVDEPPPVDDTVYLTTGDDSYADQPGIEKLDGLAGSDTLTLAFTSEHLDARDGGNGFLSLLRQGQEYIKIRNIERVAFTDITFAKNEAGAWVVEGPTDEPGVTYLTNGNDTYADQPGNEKLDGRTGTDTVTLAFTSQDLDARDAGNGFLALSRNGEEFIQIRNMERVAFTDKVFAKVGGNWTIETPGASAPSEKLLSSYNDTYADGPGLVKLDGGAGTDTVIMGTSSANLNGGSTSDGYLWLSTNGEQTIQIKNIEKVIYTDITFTKGIDGNWTISPTTTPAAEVLTQDDPNVAQMPIGTGVGTQHDVFVINAAYAGYTLDLSDTHAVTVTSPGGTTDMLHGFEVIRFSDFSISIPHDHTA